MHDPQTRVEERLKQHSWGALSSQGCVLGLDVGSYGLRAALVDLHQHTYLCQQREIANYDHATMVSEAISLGQSLLDEKQVSNEYLVRVGVGFSGPVDARRGVVIRSPRVPGWEQYPLAEQIEDAFGAATLVDNDANLIALAEATFGAGRDVKDLFYLHLSSGVGGGLVLDGRLYHGAATMAGEIGHAPIGLVDPARPNEPPATLEERVSIRGLLSRAAELDLHTDLLSEVFGDGLAGQQVVRETVDILAVRLAQIAALIDPHMIILGGVVVRNGGEPFVNAIQERMRTFMQSLVEHPVPVVASALGFESVAIGGVALALESLVD